MCATFFVDFLSDINGGEGNRQMRQEDADAVLIVLSSFANGHGDHAAYRDAGAMEASTGEIEESYGLDR